MITLLLGCFLNGFLFHVDPSAIAEDTRILIHFICIASDLNLITTLYIDYRRIAKESEES